MVFFSIEQVENVLKLNEIKRMYSCEVEKNNNTNKIYLIYSTADYKGRIKLSSYH